MPVDSTNPDCETVLVAVAAAVVQERLQFWLSATVSDICCRLLALIAGLAPFTHVGDVYGTKINSFSPIFSVKDEILY